MTVGRGVGIVGRRGYNGDRPAGGGGGVTMRRTLFNLLAVGLATLCVALGAMWVRSYWRGDVVHVWSTSVTRGAISFDGGALIFSSDRDRPDGPTLDWEYGELWGISRTSFGSPLWAAGGFAYYDVEERWAYKENRTYVLIPYWFLVTATAVVPAVWAVRRGGGSGSRPGGRRAGCAPGAGTTCGRRRGGADGQ